jgi:hypothetical protein
LKHPAALRETLFAMSHEESRSATLPSVDEVRRIVAIADPVIRNLEITHCYSRLAAEFAVRVDDGANWCTFATWASRQAGRTVRGEDLLDHLGNRLADRRWLLHPITTLWRLLLRRGLFQRETRIGRLTAELHTPFDAFEGASAAVARGNLRVFEEIGLEFARYLDECLSDTSVEESEVRRFLDRLRPGDPPEGQLYLRQAFMHYERLRVERQPKARAELAVLANLEIGLHEQTRLQPEIRKALDAAHAAKEDLGRRALETLFPSAKRSWAVVRVPAAAAIGVVAAGFQRTSSRVAREAITDSLMVLRLPTRVLALGTHLADAYPDVLDEPADAELVELLAQYEPVAPAPDDCGARDWSDLHQRMHYLVHLFRAFHLNEQLSRPPFTPEQVASFSRGVVPDGEL